MIDFIDYSQYRTWMDCPMAWWEKYIAGLQKAWPEAQRDDALCIGSMVHNALENLHTIGEVRIDDSVVEEVTPKPEAYQLARVLVEGYAATFPAEQWEVQTCEEPVMFPLRGGGMGLAKVDRFFHLSRHTEIPVGDGTVMALAPGWWVAEYKTKAQNIDRPTWSANWTTNLQADFQCLALKERLGVYPEGVVVTALEKPTQYTPERKCKGCEGTFELATWVKGEDGLSTCPFCGHRQKVTEYKPKTERRPSYFRLAAVRSPERLESSREQIAGVWERMKTMEELGPTAEPWNWEGCVEAIWKRKCDYFEPHAYGVTAGEAGGFVQIDPTGYVGRLLRVA